MFKVHCSFILVLSPVCASCNYLINLSDIYIQNCKLGLDLHQIECLAFSLPFLLGSILIARTFAKCYCFESSSYLIQIHGRMFFLSLTLFVRILSSIHVKKAAHMIGKNAAAVDVSVQWCRSEGDFGISLGLKPWCHWLKVSKFDTIKPKVSVSVSNWKFWSRSYRYFVNNYL